MVQTPSPRQFEEAEKVVAEKLDQVVRGEKEVSAEERVLASLRAVEESLGKKGELESPDDIRRNLLESDDPILAATGKALNDQIEEEMGDLLRTAEYLKQASSIYMENKESLNAEQQIALETLANSVAPIISQLQVAIETKDVLSAHRMSEIRVSISRGEKQIQSLSEPKQEVKNEEPQPVKAKEEPKTEEKLAIEDAKNIFVNLSRQREAGTLQAPEMLAAAETRLKEEGIDTKELLRNALVNEFAPQQASSRAPGEEVSLRPSLDGAADEKFTLPAIFRSPENTQVETKEKPQKVKTLPTSKEIREAIERGDEKALNELLLQVPSDKRASFYDLAQKMQAAIVAEKDTKAPEVTVPTRAESLAGELKPKKGILSKVLGSIKWTETAADVMAKAQPRPEPKPEERKEDKGPQAPSFLARMVAKAKTIMQPKEKPVRQEPSLGEVKSPAVSGYAERVAQFDKIIAQGPTPERPIANQPPSPAVGVGQGLAQAEVSVKTVETNTPTAQPQVSKMAVPARAVSRTAGDSAKEALANMYPDGWENHTMQISEEQAQRERAQLYARQTGQTLPPEARLEPGTFTIEITPEIAQQRQDIARAVAAEVKANTESSLQKQQGGWDDPTLLAEAEAFAGQGQTWKPVSERTVEEHLEARRAEGFSPADGDAYVEQRRKEALAELEAQLDAEAERHKKEAEYAMDARTAS